MLASQNYSLLQEVEFLSQSSKSLHGASITQSLTVSAPTLKSFIGSLVELSKQQRATIVIKGPNEDWIEEIVRHPLPKAKVYSCTAKHLQSGLAKFTAFETEFQLKQEYFLIVLSPEFSGLILAQPPLDQDKKENPRDFTQIKITCSFVPEVVEKVAEAIAQRSTLPAAVARSGSTTVSSAQLSWLTALLLKQIESSQEEAQTPTKVDLTAALRLKEQFLDRLVRELRPPITNMKTALRLLESKQLKRNQRQRYLELLQRECNRQHAVITGLLELVQLDNSAKTPETVRLEDLVPGIVSTYQPLAAEKGVVLGYTIPANLPPVNCPAAWLRQIIINLLDNSLKYTASQGRVYVQAYLRRHAVEIVFSDTGVGIDSQDLPKIFESFYRGRASSEELTSAGLGLTVVQQLLQRCGGSISVTSRVGKGSTFRIQLLLSSQNQMATNTDLDSER